MKEKTRNLLNILSQQNDFVTSNQLAEMLAVTPRSIRNYVNTLNQKSESLEPLIISTNQGYKLQKDIDTRNIKDSFVDKKEIDLLFQITLLLINHTEYLTYEKLAEKLHYSYESIRGKVQLLFAKIKNLQINVELESRIFTGIRLNGDEEQFRLLLEQFIAFEDIKKDNLIETVYQALHGLCEREAIESQVNHLDAIFSKKHVTMDFIVYVKIICHMMIMLYRFNKSQFIDKDKLTVFKENSPPEFFIASEILDKQVPLREINVEINELTNYLLSLPIYVPIDHIYHIDIKQKEIIEKALKEAEENYQIPIFSNKQNKIRITNHIVRLLNPLIGSIPIFNPHSSQTRREYLFAYSIACFLYDKLQGSLGFRTPEGEIAYLTVHIQLVIIENLQPSINTLLVYRGKQTEAELYRYKIETYFPAIKVVSIAREINIENLGDYSLIIYCDDSTEIKGNEKIIHVSKVLTGEDVNRLQLFIDSVGTTSLIDHLDYYHINEKDPILAIKLLISMSGYDYLLPNFVEREKMSTTDIGNQVALPHPFLKGSETSAKIIIGVNKKEIPWGRQKVRLIIVYIPANDLKTNENFFNEVYHCANDINLVQNLLQTNTKEEFIKIWNKKGSF
ncbi:transcriptional antiterminator [Tetragenococcus halophilus subsp. flandriensis]|uniref:BglG family transcription antiterminator n=1 Tax=Tetragenococcus halophilus TaxID=51669 RepID=UPI0023E96CD5|nr:PRD domain-containing protein [Tetragenococcus halophilus]GMA09068.1 transcriptional antiterminator [Tetragenococcus halophilus subsp. flandriensis]